MNPFLDGLDKVIASVEEVPQINVAGVRALIKREFSESSDFNLPLCEPIVQYYVQLEDQVNQVGALSGLRELRKAYDSPRYKI